MLVCEICRRECKSLLSLKTHLRRTHLESHEDYLIKFQYAGIQPLCKCGCGTPTTYFKGSFKSYCQGHFLKHKKYLYTEAVNQKRKKTCLEKYGGLSPSSSVLVREKIKKTNLLKYGTVAPAQNEFVQQKIIKTNFSKYGVSSPLENKIILEKVKQTCLRKYGVSNVSYVPEFRDKIKKQLRFSLNLLLSLCQEKKYEILFDYDDYRDCRQILPFKCLIHDKIFVTNIFNLNTNFKQCPLCKREAISLVEKELREFVSTLHSNVISSDRKTIAPRELDIHCEDKKIAIEFNGLYWHSELMNLSPKKHYEKFISCLDKDIKLFQIYEDEWRDKCEIWKSILTNAFGKTENIFYARDLRIVEDLKIEKEFLNKNHLQGHVQSIKNFFLIDKNDTPLMMISLRKPFTKNYKNTIEVARVCSSLNSVIIGGFSKLMKYVVLWSRNQNYEKILTYSDCRYSSGNVYKKYGFSFEGHTGINYDYTDGIFRFNRFKFRAQNNKPEKQIAEENNVYKLYGCGNYIWEYSL